jgi:hypothetical protein
VTEKFEVVRGMKDGKPVYFLRCRCCQVRLTDSLPTPEEAEAAPYRVEVMPVD